jgi:predicted tellurium resistance membrane protein TerC
MNRSKKPNFESLTLRMSTYQENLESLLSLPGIISLFTLSVLEIVLGIDNIIFISITADKLPRNLQQRGRTIGLTLALVVRCCLLFSISWIAGMKDALFHLGEYGVSGRALILFSGGIFLLYKTWQEIQEKIRGHESDVDSKKGSATFKAVVIQIVIIDIVFSFDSILTAVGLSGNIIIMVTAVIIAMILMMLFSGLVADFINRNPGIKMIALAFLLVIGGILVAEALVDGYNTTLTHGEELVELNKNYAYIALAFALLIESFNMREKRVKRKKDFNPDKEVES